MRGGAAASVTSGLNGSTDRSLWCTNITVYSTLLLERRHFGDRIERKAKRSPGFVVQKWKGQEADRTVSTGATQHRFVMNPAEVEHPCIICLVNEDEASSPTGVLCGMCFACGRSFCGECKPTLAASVADCPNCRAPFRVPSGDVMVARLLGLVEERSPGRHTRCVAPVLF
jgi:hypothetical protein